MTRHPRIVFIVCGVALFLVIGLLTAKPQATPYEPYLSFSPAPDGTKALALWLQQQGMHIGEWRKSWRFLPDGSGQRLLAVQPQYVQERELGFALEWVSRGNELILFDRSPVEWEEQFGLTWLDDKPAEDQPVQVEIQAAAGESGIGSSRSRTAQIAAGVRLLAGEAGVPLITDQEGIVAAAWDYGDGRITVFLTPEWLTNGAVAEYDHLALAAPSLIEPGAILWFDEYHHGYQQGPALLAVYPGWLIAGCLQLVIGLLLFLWLRGRRFGPVYTPRSWNVRRGDELLLALSSWYARRRLTADSIRHQTEYLRRQIQDRWGLPPDAGSPAVLAAAVSRWGRRDAEELVRLLQRLEQIDGRYPVKDFARDSIELKPYIERLERE